MAPAQMSYSGRSHPPSSMGASARPSSANARYATQASVLAAGASGLTVRTSASAFAAGSSSYYTPKTSDLSSMTLCYNCGEDGHLARNCKVLKKCFLCGEPGHSIKYCKSRLINQAPRRGGRGGRRGAQSRKTGQKEAPKVHSIFDQQYGEVVDAIKAAKIAETEDRKGVQAADIPDLIDLSSEPSEISSDDYDPAKSMAKVAPLCVNKQLYSKALEGYSVKPQYKPVVQLAEPSLLDQIDEEQVKEEDPDRRVEVALHRKRKGRKGRSTTYDLTPFLGY